MKDDHSDDVGRPMPYLLRLPVVLQVTGLGRSTLYKMVAEDAFPAPVNWPSAQSRGGRTTCGDGRAQGFPRHIGGSRPGLAHRTR